MTVLTDSEDISAILPYSPGIIFFSVYYVNQHSPFMLEIGLFKFISSDPKTLESIALPV